MSRFRYRDRALAEKVVQKIASYERDFVFMHVCGTHQDTLVRYGISGLLEECGVEIRQGPGCPVCVTTTREILEGIRLAEEGVIIASFGDMVRVPTPHGSLLDARSDGHDVRVMYSIHDAVKLAQRTRRDVVFVAVGFETTAPGTAIELRSGLPDNFSVLNCHRYVPPAVEALLGMGEIRLDGIIEPGHVSTIIGVRPYERITEVFRLPQVVAGFEPLDLLMASKILADQVVRGDARVENEYDRIVKYEGNTKALALMREIFRPGDREWRGFGVIPGSGMSLRDEYDFYDARQRYADILGEIESDVPNDLEGCRCGEVLRGLIYPKECPLFAKACTPSDPRGPCMVSAEGSCNIEYKHSSF